ncbi:ABC transporter permease [Exiguobacterium oxidotolerans]|uniref:ABC transporter n=1 Tax=Exiguobacterium oxidotolerans TaxID=223958 RepID=A0A653I8P9_9BACL|nr:ABC transporter permease [Exiguobacterium oxidotolerans]VWX35403.1 ABC transporter [Exiguobacterium oxidotolerans]
MMQLAKRVVRQTLNDKRSVMMILIAPLLILTLIYLLLGDTDYVPVVAVDGVTPPQVTTVLEKQELEVIALPKDVDSAKTYLTSHPDVDAVLRADREATNITLQEPSTKSSIAVKEIQAGLTSLNPAAAIETGYVHGSTDQSTFDSLGYVFLSLFSFFMVFVISAMAFVKERSDGTLERLLMTPIKRSEVILGYTMGYSVFAVMQAILIVLYTVYVLQMASNGNVFLVLLVLLLLATTAVLFGATISVFASSALQVVQLIPFTIIPQVFFSGLIALDLIPYHLGNLSYVMPIFYGASAIKEIMVYGNGFEAIWGYLLGLVGYIIVLYVINIRALKKFRNT